MIAPNWRNWVWKLGLASTLAVGGALPSLEDTALAQIKPDSTLGPESSSVTPNVLIKGFPSDQIDGGARRGANLFHSFQDFNINEGRGTYFTNPAGIKNILGRVTGANPSNILGTLGVSGGNANLFLINPNGVIFGSNARLDVRGSFMATTADAIGLANGDLFSASSGEPLPTGLLNVNPNAFFFNQIAAQPTIINRSRATSNGLQVPTGQSLLLVGGDVRLEGGRLQAPGGRVELGGLASSGSIGLSMNGSQGSLNFPDEVARADISLTNNAEVDVRAGSGGSIAINAQNFSLVGSSLQAGIDSDLGFIDSQSGDIEINASGEVNLTKGKVFGDTFIANTAGSRTVGNSGDINIKARLLLTDEAILNTRNWGQGNAGSVFIQANESVFLVHSRIYSSVNSIRVGGAMGNGGDIHIKAGSLSLSDATFLITSTSGEGDAGSVFVQVDGLVSLDAASRFASTTTTNAVGSGGDIHIKAGSLSLSNGALLANRTNGQGNAGSVFIQADKSVSLTNSRIYSDVLPTAAGRGGDINIQAESLSLIDGAELSTSTSGKGDAGNIQINASDSVNISGVRLGGVLRLLYSSGLFTTTEEAAIGQGGNIAVTTGALHIADRALLSARTSNAFRGGNITVDANTVEVTSGGQLLTTTFSSGEAGDITVNSTDSITISGSDPTFAGRVTNVGRLAVSDDGPASGLFARTQDAGAAGNLKLTTGKLTVRDGAQVSASTAGLGPGGTLAVTAPTGLVEVIGSGSRLTTETLGVKEAGSLTITTGQLLVQDGAEVTVSGRSGPASNLTVMADSILVNQGKLTAVTGAGDGGNITLGVPDLPLNLLLMRNTSEISAEALGVAPGGNININTDLLTALENSDISANAQEASGGQVLIDAQGIFGTEFRDRRTSESDITATSNLGPQFSGTVELNTPDVDPSSGLVSLPVVPVETEVVQACAPGGTGGTESEFVVTGRGGLPTNPTQVLSRDAIEVDWVALTPRGEDGSSPAVSASTTAPESAPVVEAQGWIVNQDGEVVLTASANSTQSRSAGPPPTECRASKSGS